MDCISHGKRTRYRVIPVAGIMALALGFMASRAETAHGDHDIVLPPLPANIRVPPGNTPYLLGHAVGTQNYICLPSGNKLVFKLFTPEATLFDKADRQIATHYFSPNPVETGTTRATWQHRDTSTVWGKVVPGDSATVNTDSIDWLKVTVVGAKEGPSGGDALTHTTFIQRVNTFGGLAPSQGCSSTADVGTSAFVPYKADYIFYTDK